MTNSNLPLLSAPIIERYFVTLAPDVPDQSSLQGKPGRIRSLRADGFLEIDFSCSGGPDSVFIDSFQLIECQPPSELLQASGT